MRKETSQKNKNRSGSEQAEISGVSLTHPGRVLFPEQGVTKRQLAGYYESVADLILAHVTHRPLALLRCPQGHEKQCFFQKNYTDSIVGPIDKVPLEEASGEQATYMAIGDLAGLIQLTQLGTLELHPWGSRVDMLERPDRLIFDLDPGPDVQWDSVLAAAHEMHDRLEELGLTTFVKTSGGKGLHVIAPLERRAGWDRVKQFANRIAGEMADRAPDRYIATAAKEKRVGRIFIDYLRNSRGATNVAVYSTRARAGAPVSTPVRWQDLNGVKAANQYRLDNIHAYLDSMGDDPWQGYFNVRQSVTRAMMEAVGD